MRRGKKLAAFGMAVCLSAAGCMTAFAGQWQQNGNEWRYQNDDGSYAVGWKWIDGNSDGVSECYYLNADGVMLADTVTVDGYTVNESGAWVVDGVVQTQPAAGTAGRTGGESLFKTDFIKQEYRDCYGKDIEYILRTFGTPVIPTSTSVFTIGSEQDILVIDVVLYQNMAFTFTNHQLTTIRGNGGKQKYELFNAVKDDYTIQELDALLGVKAAYDGYGYTWQLNENPSIELEYAGYSFSLAYRY